MTSRCCLRSSHH